VSQIRSARSRRESASRDMEAASRFCTVAVMVCRDYRAGEGSLSGNSTPTLKSQSSRPRAGGRAR
jgi:hypothetical protein